MQSLGSQIAGCSGRCQAFVDEKIDVSEMDVWGFSSSRSPQYKSRWPGCSDLFSVQSAKSGMIRNHDHFCWTSVALEGLLCNGHIGATTALLNPPPSNGQPPAPHLDKARASKMLGGKPAWRLENLRNFWCVS